jgi:putative DNA primase/helicase
MSEPAEGAKLKNRCWADFLALAESSPVFPTRPCLDDFLAEFATEKTAAIVKQFNVHDLSLLRAHFESNCIIPAHELCEIVLDPKIAESITDEMMASVSDPGDTPNEEDDDPHRLARTHIGRKYKHEAGVGIRFWRQQFWAWDGQRYVLIEAEQLKAELTRTIKSEFDLAWKRKKIAYEEWRKGPFYEESQDKGEPKVQRVTTGIIANTFAAMKSMVVMPDHIEPMSWLLDGGGAERRPYIAMKNGILNLEAVMNLEADCLIPHSPSWFSPICLPFEFNPDAECDKWDRFLQKSMGGDLERISILQEWAGYLLTPTTDQQKFLFLEGDGANGKSVYMAGIEAMLGRDNCTHVPLEVFGHPFMLTQTVGRLANIAAECSELDNVAEGILKAFVAGDRMTFNRKNLPPIEATPTARLILSANMRPRFADRTNAIWRRMLLVPWLIQIAEHEQVLGMDKVDWWERSGELPGIFNWAVQGLARLQKRKRFTKSSICADTIEDYRREVNPTKSYLIENYRECIGSERSESMRGFNYLRAKAVYEAYREWCNENGYKPMSDRSFGKEISRTFPGVQRERIREGNARFYAYQWLVQESLEDYYMRPRVSEDSDERMPAESSF